MGHSDDEVTFPFREDSLEAPRHVRFIAVVCRLFFVDGNRPF